MREIEIKARVKDKTRLLRNLAKENIKMSKPIKHHDVVYYIKGTKDNAPDSIWLRIRTENDATTIFTLKKQHRGELDSIEHETEVANAAELQEIIKHLGFTLYSDLTKTRQVGKIGNVEVCLDEVDGLGVFIEAEQLVPLEADGDKITKELWNVFYSLKIDKQDEVLEGYDVLLNKKLADKHI